MAAKGRLHCPRCGSDNIVWASGLPHLWSVYDCRECGYRGPLVIKDGKLSRKIRKKWEGRSKKAKNRAR